MQTRKIFSQIGVPSSPFWAFALEVDLRSEAGCGGKLLFGRLPKGAIVGGRG